jgi:hypothetical protein
MKLNAYAKEVLAIRRQQRALESQGYRKHETDWEILRGARTREVIVDVKISRCGKYVYTKLGPQSVERATPDYPANYDPFGLRAILQPPKESA